jgi:hypothetical protein
MGRISGPLSKQSTPAATRPGSRDYDASAYTPVDANTEIVARFKNGKLVAVGSNVVSPDGKALTVTQTMVGSATTILVLDKQ